MGLRNLSNATHWAMYSIPQEICIRFLLCCALLWLYIDWFSHIHQAYFTGTVAIVTSASKATLMNMDKYFIMNDYITTTKQSTTKPCAYFLGYTVFICTSVVCLYCNVPAPTTQLGFEPGLIAHSESRASAPTDSEREASNATVSSQYLT